LAPSKVAVEAVDLHPAQQELQRKKLQPKSVHLVKNAHRVLLVPSAAMRPTTQWQ
jgi:hypothetical protein